MNKKNSIILIIAVLFLGLLVSGGTYAYWTWNSNVNKNIVFNTAKNLQEYIVYDEGNSSFTGNLEVSNSFNQGIHSTISIRKTAEAANVDLVASIMMDINSIGTNMKQSSALKWVVTSGDSTNVGSVLAQGNFIGTNNGDTLTLCPSIEVTTTEKKFTIWIWLDGSENPSDLLSGETLDTVVWTQIDQLEGVNDTFEITRISANYQNISATVIDNKYNIVQYAVTSSSTTPTSWINIASADQSHVFTLNHNVSSTGIYYVWFKNSNGAIVSDHVEVTVIDTTGPNCTFGSFSKSAVNNGGKATIELTCTDNESSISSSVLQASDFTLSNNYASITSITKTSVASGYKYVIALTGNNAEGSLTVTLPQNKVKNAMNYGNGAVTSNSIMVDNTNPICTISQPATVVFNNTTTSTVTCTDNYLMNSQTLDASDFTVSSNTVASIASVSSPISVTGGFEYTITLNALRPGTYSLSLSADSINDVAGNKNILVSSTSATVSKGTCPAPTNVQIASNGNVTFTAPTLTSGTGNISYEISTNSSTGFTAITNGGNYLSQITSQTGSRTVYVRSMCDSTYYNTPSANATATTTVYTVTLYEATNGKTFINNVSESVGTYTYDEKSINVITGGTAYLYAQPDANSRFIAWTVDEVFGTITNANNVNTTITNITGDSYIQPTFERENYINTTTNVYYESLNNALYFVQSGEEIRVLENTTESYDATLDSTKTGVKLNLNGHTISLGTHYITNNGGLDIYSSVNGAILESENMSDSCVIKNNGTLTTNATSSTSSVTIRNTSNLSSACILYNASNSNAVLNSNTLLTFTNSITQINASPYRKIVQNYGSLNVTGASLINAVTGNITDSKNEGIVNDSTGNVTVSGGTVSSTDSVALNNFSTGNVTVSGGTVSSTNNIAIYNNSTGNVTVSGGSVSGATDGIRLSNGTVEMNGGEITGSNNGVNIVGQGTFTMGNKDGIVSTSSPVVNSTSTGSTTHYGVNKGSSGTFNFYDGKVTSTNGVGYTLSDDPDDMEIDYGVYKYLDNGVGTAILSLPYTINYALNGGTAAANTPSSGYIGANIEIPNPTKANYSFVGWTSSSTDGLSANALSGISSSSLTPWNGQRTLDTHFNNLTSESGTVTLTANWGINYLNVDTNQDYLTLDAAFDDVQNNQTIRVLNSVDESSNTAPELTTGKIGIKLDLNGNTISLGGNTLVNNGELDIYNSSSADGILQGSASGLITGVVSNYGTLTVNKTFDDYNVKIQNSSNVGNSVVMYLASGGNTTLYENCTVSFTNSVSSSRQVIRNGGVVTVNGATIINISSGSDITFTGNNSARIIINSGYLEAVGVAINYNLSDVINNNLPSIEINGGSINAGTNAIVSYAETVGKIKITDGILNSDTGNAIRCVISSNVEYIVEGGSIESNNGYGIEAGDCNFNITGGTVIGGTSGIYHVGTGIVNVGDIDLIPTDTSPVISSTASSGTYYGVENDGIFNFYGGKVTAKLGAGSSIKNTPTNVYPNYSISKAVASGIETAKLVSSVSTIMPATEIINGTDDGTSTGYFLNTNIPRNTITTIQFSNQLNSCTVNNSTCYDISSTQDGSVKMYGSNGNYTISQSGGVVFPYNSSSLFYNLVNLTSIDMSQYINLNNVDNMSYMFYGDSSLSQVYFPTSNLVTANIEGIFNGCTSLTTINNISYLGTNLTNINNAFLNTSLLNNSTLNTILGFCSNSSNIDSSKRNATYIGMLQSYYDGKFNNSSLSNYNAYLAAGWSFWN